MSSQHPNESSRPNGSSSPSPPGLDEPASSQQPAPGHVNGERSSTAAVSPDSPFHDRLVELAAMAYKGAANDEPDIVAALVSKARWNSAMLEAARDSVPELIGIGEDEHLGSATAHLHHASQVVRRRVY